MSMSDRIVVLNKGAIEQQGKPEEIYQSPSTPFTAKFIGKSNWLDQDTMFRPETASLEKKMATKNIAQWWMESSSWEKIISFIWMPGENSGLWNPHADMTSVPMYLFI